MNPRAAINDLHPFQGCPFGQKRLSIQLLRIRNSRIDYSKPSLLLQHFFCICLSLFKYTGTVQTGCYEVPGPAANIIFIEKRSSCPSSLSRGGLPPLPDLSGRNCNVFLTKMDALPPETNCRNSLSELFLAYIRSQPNLLSLLLIIDITHDSRLKSSLPGR